MADLFRFYPNNTCGEIPEQLRIVHLTHSFPPERNTGVERYVFDLSHLCLSHGHQVLVLTGGYPGGMIGEYYHYDTIPVFRCGNGYLSGFYGSFRNRRNDRAALSAIERFKPDLVHLHHLLHFSAALVEELIERSIPLVCTLHDYWLLCQRITLSSNNDPECVGSNLKRCTRCLKTGNPLRDGLRHLLVRLRQGDYRRLALLPITFIAPATFLIERFHKDGFPAPMTHLEHFSAISTKKMKLGKSAIFLYLGGAVEHKGWRILENALKKLQRNDFRLISIGARFDDKRVETLPCLSFEESDLLYAKANCLIIPSLWSEVQPLSLLESYRKKMMFIGSDVGGIAEFQLRYGNGQLFERGNADDLAEKMNNWIEAYPEQLSRIVFDRQAFSPEVHWKALLTLYHERIRRTANRS